MTNYVKHVKTGLREIPCGYWTANEHCREIMKESPGMVGYLCDECSEHFQKVKEGMSLLGISYKEDKILCVV